MLMPSIFGENLFDDFFTPFYYDDKDEKKAEKKLYGRRAHAQNMMKTDIVKQTVAMNWMSIFRDLRKTRFRYS